MSVETQKSHKKKSSKESSKHLNSIALRAYSGQQKSAKSPIDDEQITEFLPMVHKIVRQVVTYLKPPLSFEDMVSAGTVGLVKAARDFDPAHGAEFKTYAYIRIKGAILDELRGWSFVPANISKKIRQVQEISQKIIQKKGVAPTDTELAGELGITIDELYEMFGNARAQQFVSIDGFGDETPALSNLLVADNVDSPGEQLERAELIDVLTDSIQELPQKHRHVVVLYYQQHLTMKQIAEILEITESRVSQMHSSALFNLSVKLKEWDDGRL